MIFADMIRDMWVTHGMMRATCQAIKRAKSKWGRKSVEKNKEKKERKERKRRRGKRERERERKEDPIVSSSNFRRSHG